MMEKEVQGLRLVAAHVNLVQRHMHDSINRLLIRLVEHDQSKYLPDELPLVTGKAYLDTLLYNSEEYKAALANVKAAVTAHYDNNSHHPEHWANGIVDMSLLDLLEMMCDWKAAGETSGGNIEASIASNTERFRLSPDVVSILTNTAKELGWIV